MKIGYWSKSNLIRKTSWNVLLIFILTKLSKNKKKTGVDLEFSLWKISQDHFTTCYTFLLLHYKNVSNFIIWGFKWLIRKTTIKKIIQSNIGASELGLGFDFYLRTLIQKKSQLFIVWYLLKKINREIWWEHLATIKMEGRRGLGLLKKTRS